MYDTCEIASFYLFSESKQSENCKCTSITQCEWSKKLLNELDDLSPTNTYRIKAITFIRKQICDVAAKAINCCDLDYSSQNSTR